MPERKQISDAIQHKPFHPELQLVKKDEIIGDPFVIYDILIIKDWDSKEFGPQTFAKVAIGDPKETTPDRVVNLSGVAVMRSLGILKQKGITNVETRLIKTTLDNGNDLWELV